LRAIEPNSKARRRRILESINFLFAKQIAERLSIGIDFGAAVDGCYRMQAAEPIARLRQHF
jgi:hypothetical protein